MVVAEEMATAAPAMEFNESFLALTSKPPCYSSRRYMFRAENSAHVAKCINSTREKTRRHPGAAEAEASGPRSKT